MNKKQPIIISIDFEDFSFDYARSLGLKDKILRISQLEKSYFLIKNIIETNFENKNLTFFITGIVCEHAKDLVKQIYSDGNEIASHYYHHDMIYSQKPEEFLNNIKKAKSVIKKTIGEEPSGFRAPAFSMLPNNKWAYEIIMDNFTYDSSFVTTESLNKLKKNNDYLFKNKNFKEIFIFSRPMFNKNFQVRSGGTSFKLFPYQTLIKTLKMTQASGHIPQVYLHPYEFLNQNEFLLRWKDLEGLSFGKKIFSRARQFQWLSYGNRSVSTKLIELSKNFYHLGNIKDFLRNNVKAQ